MKRLKKKSVLEALNAVKAASRDGLLRPDDVVKAARSKDSVLHRYFTWDDHKAGIKCRREEARALISEVYIENSETHERTPAYVSLLSDRAAGGGYRSTNEVLSSAELRRDMLITAKEELRQWTERHMTLTSLVEKVSRAAGIRAPRLAPLRPVKKKSAKKKAAKKVVKPKKTVKFKKRPAKKAKKKRRGAG